MRKLRVLVWFCWLLPCAPALLAGEPAEEEEKPAAAAGSKLPASGEAALDAALAPYRLGSPVLAGNMAALPILVPERKVDLLDYLTLEEALKKKVLVVRELGGGGTVPRLQMESGAKTCIFIPFGSIVTGGKQDRMTRYDIVLEPGEKKQVEVYCVEQGRWSAGMRGHKFGVGAGGGGMMGSYGFREAGGKLKQAEVWKRVGESSKAMGNASASGSFGGNFDTDAYKQLAARLEAVKGAVGRLPRACGVVMIVNGKVVGAEIYASPAYFRKIWPQLFAASVVDAAGAREKQPVDAGKAAELAGAHLAELAGAKITSQQKSGLTRLSADGKAALGGAIIEAEKGRLVYFRWFPKGGQAAARKK